MALEKLALRQQLAVLKRSVKRPRLRRRDRLFWACRSQLWTHWRSGLILVNPETVIRWHRQGFRLFWRWKSRANQLGRPSLSPEVISLIRRMALENPTWGAPRICSELRRRVAGLGIKEIVTAPQSPWQNPHAERVIGSIRRACLDHLIVLSENHLRRILKEYVRYYNQSRPHLSLERNAPIPRHVEPPSQGPIVTFPEVGGLHHRYTRAA